MAPEPESSPDPPRTVNQSVLPETRREWAALVMGVLVLFHAVALIWGIAASLLGSLTEELELDSWISWIGGLLALHLLVWGGLMVWGRMEQLRRLSSTLIDVVASAPFDNTRQAGAIRSWLQEKAVPEISRAARAFGGSLLTSIVAAFVIALITNLALLGTLMVTNLQSERLGEQNELITLEGRITSLNQQFQQEQAEAELLYNQISAILLDPEAPIHQQIFALRNLPRAMAYPVHRVDGEKLEEYRKASPDAQDGIDLKRASYPNLIPLRDLFRGYLAFDRVGTALQGLEAPHDALSGSALTEEQRRALEPLGELSAEILRTLARLGPPGSIRVDEEDYAWEDQPSRSLPEGKERIAVWHYLNPPPGPEDEEAETRSDPGRVPWPLQPLELDRVRAEPDPERRNFPPEVFVNLTFLARWETRGLQLPFLPTEGIRIVLENDADLRRAQLPGANLFRAELPGADLFRAQLPGADLIGAELARADLTRAQLPGAYLLDAELPGANLFRVQLPGANLYGAELPGVDLGGADLAGANLYGAELAGADLGRAELPGANLAHAELPGANLTRADLATADLSLAELPGADLTEVELFGAELVGAQLFGEAAKVVRKVLPSRFGEGLAVYHVTELKTASNETRPSQKLKLPGVLLEGVVLNGEVVRLTKPSHEPPRVLPPNAPEFDRTVYERFLESRWERVTLPVSHMESAKAYFGEDAVTVVNLSTSTGDLVRVPSSLTPSRLRKMYELSEFGFSLRRLFDLIRQSGPGWVFEADRQVRFVDDNGHYPAFLDEATREAFLQALGPKPKPGDDGFSPELEQAWCRVRCDLDRVVTEKTHPELFASRKEWSLEKAWEIAKSGETDPFKPLYRPGPPTGLQREPVTDCDCKNADETEATPASPHR